MKRAILLLPLAIFLVVAVFLFRGLWLDPSELPSALIDKPFPAFALPGVLEPGKTYTQADLKGRPALVNVWGTWCPTCRFEHPVLAKLAEQGVVIVGINYKDDNAAAQKWLQDLHDPYVLNIADAQGTLGLDLGVYGAPETYVIDKDGIIRHKLVGAVDEKVWREQLAPIYQRLVDEAGGK
ncbi:cytochrome c biogenesis protein CcmG, thiol:disulfide interchange protein DsbE [Pseudomonas citronellolis]|uniref:Cytochrome c biogenesis protein CcmG, thiol:disulfide interchange protein DsbE n=1 Tax=Pseudomonas citronellolis TaxID=53408 RepID=A0AAQ1R028_9PSED|nr:MULTISPECIES: thiol:disulfide interchange protein DsbE [Pseudomonas]KSW23153.1 thiol:disulfide interchange protein [Pseudomonas sp. ADP]MCL6691921.1 thiol:disulfide interchange protein DsbE [Pseudomonas sp. R3.Fl]NTX92742.1 DsbE family thiol:disulfide interchange protein [Pseudomonas sp. UMA643]NTY18428.1 DsbE family thiol:disulfide interchange protein [Pseudomonas sp. UMC3103]NTY26962.1 DsbE family thiol:disulfide interchange protein [Pseudomonas sp. UMA603]NTY33495.1 DsbE family thiol:di